MDLNLEQDIRSVSDLKRYTKKIFDHIHETGRMVILTVNGKADAVLMDTKTYEKQMKATQLSKLLVPAEEEIRSHRTRPMRTFLKEFKHAKKISG